MQRDLKQYIQSVRLLFTRLRSGRRGDLDPVRDWHASLIGAGVLTFLLFAVAGYTYFFVLMVHQEDATPDAGLRAPLDRGALSRTVEAYRTRNDAFAALRVTPPETPNPGVVAPAEANQTDNVDDSATTTEQTEEQLSPSAETVL